MASASIDTFLHWRVVRALPQTGPLPKDLRTLTVPFGDLVKMGRDGLEARRKKVKNRPTAQAKNVLHKRILRDTYQSSRGVETALKMCGVTDCWAKLATELGEKKSDIINHLNTLANRRNAVVHEGDIMRMSKPQNIKHQPLERSDIDDELTWVRSFVNAMSRIA